MQWNADLTNEVVKTVRKTGNLPVSDGFSFSASPSFASQTLVYGMNRPLYLGVGFVRRRLPWNGKKRGYGVSREHDDRKFFRPRIPLLSLFGGKTPEIKADPLRKRYAEFGSPLTNTGIGEVGGA